MRLLVRILYILLAIAIVVLAYYVMIWVLGMLGIHVPQQILQVCFVILGLCAAIWALTGRMDTLFSGWNSPPGP
jgi:xanthosine utilization system XapX-like protein